MIYHTPTGEAAIRHILCSIKSERRATMIKTISYHTTTTHISYSVFVKPYQVSAARGVA